MLKIMKTPSTERCSSSPKSRYKHQAVKNNTQYCPPSFATTVLRSLQDLKHIKTGWSLPSNQWVTVSQCSQFIQPSAQPSLPRPGNLRPEPLQYSSTLSPISSPQTQVPASCLTAQILLSQTSTFLVASTSLDPLSLLLTSQQTHSGPYCEEDGVERSRGAMK